MFLPELWAASRGAAAETLAPKPYSLLRQEQELHRGPREQSSAASVGSGGGDGDEGKHEPGLEGADSLSSRSSLNEDPIASISVEGSEEGAPNQLHPQPGKEDLRPEAARADADPLSLKDTADEASSSSPPVATPLQPLVHVSPTSLTPLPRLADAEESHSTGDSDEVVMEPAPPLSAGRWRLEVGLLQGTRRLRTCP